MPGGVMAAGWWVEAAGPAWWFTRQPSTCWCCPIITYPGVTWVCMSLNVNLGMTACFTVNKKISVCPFNFGNAYWWTYLTLPTSGFHGLSPLFCFLHHHPNTATCTPVHHPSTNNPQTSCQDALRMRPKWQVCLCVCVCMPRVEKGVKVFYKVTLATATVTSALDKTSRVPQRTHHSTPISSSDSITYTPPLLLSSLSYCPFTPIACAKRDDPHLHKVSVGSLDR